MIGRMGEGGRGRLLVVDVSGTGSELLVEAEVVEENGVGERGVLQFIDKKS